MIDQKIAYVHELILNGADSLKILDAVSKQFPEDKPEYLISEAMELIVEAAGQPREELIGWSINATKNVYRKCMEIGDYPGALRAAKQISDLAMFLLPMEEID